MTDANLTAEDVLEAWIEKEVVSPQAVAQARSTGMQPADLVQLILRQAASQGVQPEQLLAVAASSLAERATASEDSSTLEGQRPPGIDPTPAPEQDQLRQELLNEELDRLQQAPGEKAQETLESANALPANRRRMMRQAQQQAVNDAWRRARRALRRGGDDFSTLPDAYTSHLHRVKRHLAPFAIEQGQQLDESQIGIPGQLNSLRMTILMRAEQMKVTPELQEEFYGTTMAATFRRLERERQGDRIERTELAIASLTHWQRVRIDRLQRLLRGMRGYVESEQSEGLRWVNIVGALGELASLFTSREQGLARIAALYYHEALSTLVSWLRDNNEGPNDPALLRGLLSPSNNVAAYIGRIIQQSPTRDHTRKREVALKLIQISTAGAAALADREAGEHADLELDWLDTLRLPLPSESAPRWTVVQILTHMLMVPNVLPLDTGPKSYLEATSGIARIVLRDKTRTAASFFNAGISILRIAKKQRNARYALMRGCLNALGFCWAMRLNPRAIGDALGSGDGLDCAVNLFGSASDAGAVLVQQRPLLQRFASELTTAIHSQPGLRRVHEGEMYRMTLSWRSMGLEVTDVPSGIDTLTETAREIFHTNARLLGLDEETLAVDFLSGHAESAQLVVALYTAVFGGDEGPLEGWIEAVSSLMGRFFEMMDDPVGSAVALHDDFGESGPLVAAGVVSPAEWEREWDERWQRCESLGNVFSEVFV